VSVVLIPAIALKIYLWRHRSGTLARDDLRESDDGIGLSRERDKTQSGRENEVQEASVAKLRATLLQWLAHFWRFARVSPYKRINIALIGTLMLG